MQSYLQNLRTGDQTLLNPHRTLIGTASHAVVRTGGSGPILAALAVHYTSGWVLHGLSDDPCVLFNHTPFRAGHQVSPCSDDVLVIGEDRYRFVGIDATVGPLRRMRTAPLPNCCVYIRDTAGVEECRVVDHGLLFGRLPVCHVRFADTRLSRLHALLVDHAGDWFVHALAKGPIGRNREAVVDFARIEDGDELQIGPLFVRIELRTGAPDTPLPYGHPEPIEAPETSTDALWGSETVDPSDQPEPEPAQNSEAIRSAAASLDHWLKSHDTEPSSPSHGGGLGAWLGSQRERLTRFWHDTPDATTARSLRTAGRISEAFAVLDRAIRARPDSPGLLRELYRLYEGVELFDLCYRPLRQIHKLATARGAADTWALESLARLCERLGQERPDMLDRAVGYWKKLEDATGVSYARERAAAMARRAMRDGGYTGAHGNAG